MKTYNIFYVLLALVIVSCSNSDDSASDDDPKNSIDVDYSLLLSKDGMLNTQFLNANAEVITFNPTKSSLLETTIPDLKKIEGNSFLQYHKNGDCGGTLIKHDFSSDTFKEIVVFEDLLDCDLMATAITASDSSVFISYILTNSGSISYMVRIINTNSTELTFEEVILNKKPVSLAFANNKLFVLTIDDQITNENSISIINLSSNSLTDEINLGYDAERIFKDGNDNIIVSYEELHGTLNSSTLAIVYTQYEENKEPNFVNSVSNKLDGIGRLYYPAVSGTHSTYSEIPAVYDFTQNLTILYAYENFLSESKRNSEFEIDNTTAVGYDAENNFILIGYKKMGAVNKGGMLRIKPAPEPAFIDNINLDGVPTEIIVN